MHGFSATFFSPVPDAKEHIPEDNDFYCLRGQANGQALFLYLGHKVAVILTVVL